MNDRPSKPRRTLLGLGLVKVSWSDRFLLLRAIGWFLFASFVIAFIPFEKVAVMASRPIRARSQTAETLKPHLRRVRWAVEALADRAPWRALCFQRGLTAHLLLRREGTPATLYYGAAQQPGRGLLAHVWVKVGELEVIGCEAAAGHSVLATFPATGFGYPAANPDSP